LLDSPGVRVLCIIFQHFPVPEYVVEENKPAPLEQCQPHFVIPVISRFVRINKDKIDELGNQIKNLEEKIIEKEELIRTQKKVLAELVRTYYEYNRQDIFAEITGNAMTSAFLSSEDYISQMGTKVGEILASIKALKAGLEIERNDIVNKKNKTVELKNDLEDKNANLEASKIQKDRLLADTKGEEAKYEKLLRRVEEQKQDLLGDIDELYIENSAEIEALKASLPKPDSKYRASTSWYYSQKDPRWGNNRIGNSKSLMKDFGCAISDVAMVFTYHGDSISPKTLAKKPIFSWDLINWPTNSGEVVSGGNVNLIKNTKHGGVSWSEIDNEIKKDNPVIVFVRAKGKAGHYVVIHNKDKNGKYVVHDPYFGSNIFLDSTFKLLSKMYDVSVSKSSVDQMILYK